MKLSTISASAFVIMSLCGIAISEEAKPANANDNDKLQNTEKNSATPEQKILAKPTNTQKPKSAMSVDSYKRLISKKIAERTQVMKAAGPGTVETKFRVNEEGRIDNIVIKKSTNPKHNEHVASILSGVKLPPPPNGPLELGQIFSFK